ncbi:MAG: hypothetical protein M1829_000117 [Trizodia sp. TS-e1964]|nr:MAG: hypothetical protein M1829_000117 [Trizodia sp. TS-e1964]
MALQRPLSSALLLLHLHSVPLQPSPALTLLLHPTRRHESSARRTKKKLHVAPASIFEKPSSSSSTTTTNSPTGDHILYTPPPAAPSVYHTPTPFLPLTDIRRTLYPPAAPPPVESQEGECKKPLPAVRAPYEKKYHLTPADVQEMRALRAQDETTWTRERLAEKFGCSPYFVGIVAGASEAWKEQGRSRLEAVKARWGARRRDAREERIKRKEGWLRDE